MREISLDRAHFSGLAAEVIQGGSTFRFRATGGSMSPFIKDGDVLEVRPIEATTIRRADVVLYRRSDRRLIAHRVVGSSGRNCPPALLLQGDVSLRGKEVVTPASVLGRVVSVQRNDRLIVLDTGLWRWLGWAWIALSPFSRWFYRILAGVKSRIKFRKPS